VKDTKDVCFKYNSPVLQIAVSDRSGVSDACARHNEVNSSAGRSARALSGYGRPVAMTIARQAQISCDNPRAGRDQSIHGCGADAASRDRD